MKKILVLSFVILIIVVLVCNRSNNKIDSKDNLIEKQEVVKIKELDIDVIENKENELVFSFSIDDFIDSYNGYYYKDKKTKYIKPTSEWIIHEYDNSVHSNYGTYYYNYYLGMNSIIDKTNPKKAYTSDGRTTSVIEVPSKG